MEHKKKTDIYGYCALCGKYKKMTFEHIPPKGAFNDRKAKIISGTSYINGLTKTDFVDLKDLPYKEQQKGKGLNSICAECNNLTGSYYGNAYIEFAHNLAYLITENDIEKGRIITVRYL